MEQTNKGIKFKYYRTADAIANDTTRSNYDIAFVEDKKAIITHGISFGEPADLSDYYSREEVDYNIISINNKFSNYYNKSEIDNKFKEHSD